MNLLKSINTSLASATIMVFLITVTSELLADTALEEVIVTAQKREASIQDVPIAVTGVSAGQLERGAMQTILDVAKIVPNVELHTVTQSGASLGASIRGVGFDDLEKSYEPAVGISVDGVFMASNSGAVVDFFDIESVEVLRGPQGTLYGRNTIGGVINIKRTEPTGKWGLKVEGTLAANQRRDAKALVNVPLGEKGGIKLGYRRLAQDSHLFNITRNERRKHLDTDVRSIAARYNFTDETSVTVSYDIYDHNTTPPDIIATGTSDSVFCAGTSKIGCFADSGAISRDNNYNVANAHLPITSTIEGKNVTVNAVHERDTFTLKYIMGYMDFDELAIFNSWGAPVTTFPVRRDQTYDQFSHELQFISNFDGPFNFVSGVYYLETDSFLTSGPAQNFTTFQDANAWAVFGEVSYEFKSLWTFTAGARYTKEEKDLDFMRFKNNADRASKTANLELKPDFSDDNITYKFIVQRELPVGMVYVSFSTGFRSGGFNSRASNTATVGPYGSEEVKSWEIGLRTQPTDNLQLNVTAFHTKYTDKQQFVVTNGRQCGLVATATCTFVRNAAKTTNIGVELEGIWKPTEALTIRASYGYLNADFDSYDFDGRDIADNARVIYAPENMGSVNAEHYSEIFGGELTISGTFSARSKVFGNAPFETYSFQTGPDITIESHEQLDFSATYRREMSKGAFKVVLYATDLLEDGGRVSRAFDAGAFAWQELVPRRTLGATFGYEL